MKLATTDKLEDDRRDARNKLDERIIEITNSDFMEFFVNDKKVKFVELLDSLKNWQDGLINNYQEALEKLNEYVANQVSFWINFLN